MAVGNENRVISSGDPWGDYLRLYKNKEAEAREIDENEELEKRLNARSDVEEIHPDQLEVSHFYRFLEVFVAR